MTKSELLARMDSAELSRWQVFYARELFSEDRADLRNGILCSLTDACHRSKGNARPPAEYMPVKPVTKREYQPKQGEHLMQANFQQAMRAFGKKTKKA